MKVFTQLSYNEREKIYRGRCGRKTIQTIAEELGRAASTISREIKRNGDKYGYLYPGAAHEMARKRKHKRPPKIDKNHELQAFITKKLKEKWSPLMISIEWNSKNGEQKISKETIYTWIYSKNVRGLELYKLLIRSHKKRGFKYKIRRSKIRNKVSIHERPDAINSRLEIGHYEGDLIFNKGSQSKNICTLIDRVTRKAVMIKNDDKRTETVINSLLQRIKEEKLTIKSITFDNGSEFADHQKLNQIGIQTYFCDPGSPWQKGAIENLNGVLRRFLPFDRPAHEITTSVVARINKQINNMPRAVLLNKTPLDFERAIK